jgi:UDP-N-acetylglucosamine 2-epimerase (non-hydrolysing)
MIKILIVLGTRPEAIKMAPLYLALKSRTDKFKTILCVTAQHRQMLDQVLNVFGITPDIDLNLMTPGQDLFDVSATVLLRMREVFETYRPDAMLVHGDTTTAFAASIAGFYAGVPVGHVEAGLRTYNMHAPFPEEFNRQVVSKLAKWHFAPTKVSLANLIKEGVPKSAITVTGNTVIDALHFVLGRLDADPVRQASVYKLLDTKLLFNWKETKIVLVTGHRRENLGEGFLQICGAIKVLAEKYPEIRFVYPVHLNPAVQKPVMAVLAGLVNVHLIGPLDYEPFVSLLKHSHLVMTDSGGIQEEAPSLGIPVLVMREVTERPEAVEAGTVRLVGADENRIIKNVSDLLDDPAAYDAMAWAHNPYGDGNASRQIVAVLEGMAC